MLLLWLFVLAVSAYVLLGRRPRRAGSRAPLSRSRGAAPATGRAKKFRPSAFAATAAGGDASTTTSFDAIVIGSGPGGLTCASVLQRFDPERFGRIAVLEQHDVPGGTLHSFKVDGADVSAGTHYIGTVGAAPPGRVSTTHVARSQSGRMLALALGEPLSLSERAARDARERASEGQDVGGGDDAAAAAETASSAAAALFPDPPTALGTRVDALQRWQRLAMDHDIVTLAMPEGSPADGPGAARARQAGLDPRKWRVFGTGEHRLLALRDEFPESAAALTALHQEVRRGSAASAVLLLVRIAPNLTLRLAPVLRRVWPWFADYERLTAKTTAQIMDECGIRDPLLRRAVTYLFGDYGTTPSESPFLITALVENHYRSGGFFPYGGSAAMASRLVAAVQHGGGEVFVNARVREIVCEPEGNSGRFRATGVRVARQQFVQAVTSGASAKDSGALAAAAAAAAAAAGAGTGAAANAGGADEDVVLRAPVIVSTAGAFALFSSLLPQQVRDSAATRATRERLARSEPTPAQTDVSLRPSGVHLQVFVSLDEDTPVTASNHWIFSDTSDDFEMSRPQPRATAASSGGSDTFGGDGASADGGGAGAPLFAGGMFVSFESAKDQSYRARCPGRQSMIIVTETTFQSWDEWVRSHGAWRRYQPGKSSTTCSDDSSPDGSGGTSSSGTPDQQRQQPQQEEEEARRAAFEAAKRAAADVLLERAMERLPFLRGKVREVEVGSPLSANQYLARVYGDSYGFAHTRERFALDAPEVAKVAVNNVDGLYASGQDVMSAGITGALAGGFITAFHISFRALRASIGQIIFPPSE